MAIGQSHTLGTLLRRARRAAGLTQAELAERAGISPRSMSDIERGVSHTPHKDTVILLADALGLEGTDRESFMAAAGRVRSPASRGSPGLGMSSREMARPFVGRQREMALLERHVSGEGPPLLLLAGEPGIGKTRLLQAAIPRAAAQGLCVLEGGCSRQGGQEPYAPVLEALQRYLRGLSGVDARAQLRGCAWLVRLLPELAEGPIEALPNWTVPAEHERRLMVDAAVRFLSNIAGPAGTVLVLDDLQWAGQDALDLLHAFVRAAGEIPLRIIGAYRDTEVRPEHPLSETLADLVHAGLAVRRLLRPLNREEAARLLEGLMGNTAPAVDYRMRARALERAGGVPFFLVSCAQDIELGVAEPGSGAGVPWDVAQSIRQRVAALGEGAGEMLGAAAVIGRMMSLKLLVTTTLQPEAAVLRGLDVACEGRLLEEMSDGRYQFVHDVIREVVESDLGPARRMILHRHVAEALEQGMGELPVELLAYHYDRSEEQDKALPYLERAGDRAAAQGGLAAAVEYYQKAVRRLDELGHLSEAARIREKLAGALRTRALYDEALVVLEGAAETHKVSGDLECLGRVTAQIGQVLGDRGTPEQGMARVKPLLRQLEKNGPSPALALLHTTMAWLLLNVGQYTSQLEAAERAIELAGAMGDERIRAQAELWRAEALDSLWGRHESLSAFERAGAVAEAAGDMQTLIHALLMIAEGYRERDEAEAARQTERALAVAERYGNPVYMAFALEELSLGAIAAGNWDQARVSIERALDLSRRVNASWALTYCLLAAGHLRMLEGHWTEAFEHLEEGAAAAARIGNLHALRVSQQRLAECDLLDGRPEAARDRLLPLLDRPAMVEPAVTELLPVLARAILTLGDIEGADDLANQGVSRARQAHMRYLLAEALHVQALVRMRQGRAREAQQILDEGLVLARQMPYYPYTEARLLHVFGRLHMALGEHGPARERLEEALAIFRRLGAVKDAERTGQDISTLPRQGAEDQS